VPRIAAVNPRRYRNRRGPLGVRIAIIGATGDGMSRIGRSAIDTATANRPRACAT
jgi:hypothetical protein